MHIAVEGILNVSLGKRSRGIGESGDRRARAWRGYADSRAPRQTADVTGWTLSGAKHHNCKARKGRQLKQQRKKRGKEGKQNSTPKKSRQSTKTDSVPPPSCLASPRHFPIHSRHSRRPSSTAQRRRDRVQSRQWPTGSAVDPGSPACLRLRKGCSAAGEN